MSIPMTVRRALRSAGVAGVVLCSAGMGSAWAAEVGASALCREFQPEGAHATASRRGKQAAKPCLREASLEAIGLWLREEYRRRGEAEVGKEPVGWCVVISIEARIEVLDAPEWVALAHRCLNELRDGTLEQRVEALRFLSALAEVSAAHPELSKLFPEGFGGAIQAALMSEGRELRLAAAGYATAVQHIGRDALVVVPGLLRALESNDAELRKAAASALNDLSLGFESIGYERRPTGLGEHGPAAVKVLMKATADPDKMVKLQAFGTIGRLGVAARPAVALCIRSIGSEDRVTRTGAFWAIEGLGEVAVDAMAEVIRALRDPKRAEGDRRLAANALGAMGAAAKDATPALIGALDDPSEFVQISAAMALGKIGPGAKAALTRLRAAVDQDRGAFGEYGVRAIEQIEGE